MTDRFLARDLIAYESSGIEAGLTKEQLFALKRSEFLPSTSTLQLQVQTAQFDGLCLEWAFFYEAQANGEFIKVDLPGPGFLGYNTQPFYNPLSDFQLRLKQYHLLFTNPNIQHRRNTIAALDFDATNGKVKVRTDLGPGDETRRLQQIVTRDGDKQYLSPLLIGEMIGFYAALRK